MKSGEKHVLADGKLPCGQKSLDNPAEQKGFFIAVRQDCAVRQDWFLRSFCKKSTLRYAILRRELRMASIIKAPDGRDQALAFVVGKHSVWRAKGVLPPLRNTSGPGRP
jgi:hypothetical protein